eukprot:631822-Prorocentrum_minimum.AAC.4
MCVLLRAGAGGAAGCGHRRFRSGAAAAGQAGAGGAGGPAPAAGDGAEADRAGHVQAAGAVRREERQADPRRAAGVWTKLFEWTTLGTFRIGWRNDADRRRDAAVPLIQRFDPNSSPKKKFRKRSRQNFPGNSGKFRPIRLH